jgi:starvation-inducible outer membrane lipoprotein
MRSISIVVLMMGAVLLGISSCATVPKPLAPGELRLLSMLVSESKEPRLQGGALKPLKQF